MAAFATNPPQEDSCLGAELRPDLFPEGESSGSGHRTFHLNCPPSFQGLTEPTHAWHSLCRPWFTASLPRAWESSEKGCWQEELPFPLPVPSLSVGPTTGAFLVLQLPSKAPWDFTWQVRSATPSGRCYHFLGPHSASEQKYALHTQLASILTAVLGGGPHYPLVQVGSWDSEKLSNNPMLPQLGNSTARSPIPLNLTIELGTISYPHPTDWKTKTLPVK